VPDRPYLFSLDVLGPVSLGATEPDAKRKVTDLIQQGLSADNARKGWLDRQQALTKLRFGIRKPKTFPWKGASNLSIPLIDPLIRRYRPFLMKLVVEPDPIVEFRGEDAGAVSAERIAEAEYNWLFKTHMRALEPMAYIIDALLHRGYGIAQVGWDYATEYECRVLNVSDFLASQNIDPAQPPDPAALVPLLAREYDVDPRDPRVLRALAKAVERIAAGDAWVKLAFKRVVTDRPAVWDRDPVQIIVPPRTTDYANAEFIIVQHVLSLRRLKQMEADGLFKAGSVKKIVGDLGGASGRSNENGIADSPSMSYEQSLDDEKERIWGVEDEDNILLWEVYHWHDHDGDGMADRVVTWLHPRSATDLATRPYPYPFRRWPFVQFAFERTSRRYHSPRGISAMLEHLQRGVNTQHNQRLDAMTLRNAPVYQTPVMSGFKARNFRAVPGTVLEMPGGARMEPVLHDRGAVPEQVNEENMLRSLAESYVGTFDQALQGSQGGVENRTATEINAIVQMTAATASMDAILFQLSMQELHSMIWELWLDFRPPEVSFKLNGADEDTGEAKLVTVKKSDINKKFKLFPTGTIANTNHALELAKAKEALTFFANDQTGFIEPRALRDWYFGLLDARQARKIVQGPQAAAELQMLRQAAAALQQNPRLLEGAPQAPPEPDQQTEIIPEP
jgi:hypothetical protein